MDEEPSGAPSAADVAALARDLVSRLSAISASLSPGQHQPAGSAAGSAVSAGGAVPNFESARTVLENGARFVSPYLPADAPLRPLKALLLRILRIVTRDQTVFNSAVFEALRGALLVVEGGFRDASAALESARREADSAREAVEAHVAGALEHSRAALDDVVRLLADGRRARQALGEDLLKTQVRVDALERDRDLRAERTDAALEALEGRSAENAEKLRGLRLEWSTLRSGLRTPQAAPSGGRSLEAALTPRADDPLRAGLYVDFEEAFRGSEEEIRRRQVADVELFLGAPGPVADLGCGRGEFLQALRAAGLPAVGCDANPLMAARAREKGLEVDRADLFDWLSARRDGSLGGLTAFQVIEHLPPAGLFDLVELAAAKLAPGGVILLETVNPESAYAMKWFWMDLTHVRPVPAPSLARLLSACGFRDVRVDWRSPVPAGEAPPAALAEDPALGPVVRLLFGPQDYAAIGRK